MGYSVIICDDSRLARNFLARSLPSGFAEQQHFAASGREALALIAEGKGDLLFLDLNMPDLDGYQVLAQLRAQSSRCQVVVISGDVQPKAREKVLALGALSFLQKPLNRDDLLAELVALGLCSESLSEAPPSPQESIAGTDRMEVLREVANVAMGRAAGLMAGIFNVFVQIPVPRIQAMTASELCALIDQWQSRPGHQVISQGFVGAGICGEVLMELSSEEAHRIAALMSLSSRQPEERALMTELSSILIGACLKGIASQLELEFSQGHPIILDRTDQRVLAELGDKAVLCIRFGYQIPDEEVHQELVLLVTPDSLPALERRLTQLVN
ncbi:response regulator [Gallaecimonas xiamenensis]|uniref:MCP methylation inhibitor CheC n=1 Tax=Gallaecimonas xiamenensis 3-C-1 TaxID=745411 RepID=K2K6E1_9GAMM|nr:response regulator [Gallaecimonas xiamenensis]EKE73005.1 MCP methylation inhibitor CheC [Gallaecimonas xiamenensis 3-C-1]